MSQGIVQQRSCSCETQPFPWSLLQAPGKIRLSISRVAVFCQKCVHTSLTEFLTCAWSRRGTDPFRPRPFSSNPFRPTLFVQTFSSKPFRLTLFVQDPFRPRAFSSNPFRPILFIQPFSSNPFCPRPFSSKTLFAQDPFRPRPFSSKSFSSKAFLKLFESFRRPRGESQHQTDQTH